MEAEGWDLAAMPWDSPERLHLMVEAMRLAFADACRYIADMATNPAPLDALLSKAYAAERRALVLRIVPCSRRLTDRLLPVQTPSI